MLEMVETSQRFVVFLPCEHVKEYSKSITELTEE